MKLGLTLAGMALVLSAFPYEYTRVPASSGDLSQPSFWGGALPQNTLWFDGPGTYTVSQDVTFAGILASWGTTEIAVADGCRVALTESIGTWTGNMTLKGGLFDFGGTRGFLTNDGWADGVFAGTPSEIRLDGCVLTNMNMVILMNNGNGQPKVPEWMLTNGGGIHTLGKFQLAYYGVPAPGISCRVDGGSWVSCNAFETDGGNGGGVAYLPHSLSVSGAGTVFRSRGGAENRIGNAYAGGHVTVTDQAELDFSVNTTFVGVEARSTSNAVVVADGATARFNILYLGCNGGGGNVLRVTDEATVEAVRVHVNGGAPSVRDNLVVVSNATLRTQSLYNLSEKGSGSTIRVSGDHPRIVVSGSGDGSAFACFNEPTFLFDIPEQGYRADCVPITFSATAVRDGQTEAVAIWGDETVRFRFTGIEAFQKRLKARARVVLITSRGDIVLPDKVWEASQALLPDRCALSRVTQADGSHSLCLDVRPLDVGMRVLVR